MTEEYLNTFPVSSLLELLVETAKDLVALNGHPINTQESIQLHQRIALIRKVIAYKKLERR